MTGDWESYGGVLDNLKWDVGDRVSQISNDTTKLNVAVGYLFSTGFEALDTSVDEVEDINILLGQVGRDAGDQIKQSIRDSLDDIEKTDSTITRVKRVYNLARRDGVEFRVYTKERTFHPKLYLFELPSSGKVSNQKAIVGSSNLSGRGLESNVELNVEVGNQETLNHLSEWFENRWNESQEITPEVIEEAIVESQFGPVVQTSTPMYEDGIPEDVITPREATLRFVATHFRDEIESGTFFDKLEGDIGELLTDFQQDAVQAGTSTVDDYGGVILADSVGLGKSFIGGGILQKRKSPSESALVIAPNRLKEKWTGEMLGEDGHLPMADVDFMTRGKLSSMSTSEARTELSHYDYFLIDEAHHLKNQRSQTYRNITSIDRADREFILLTATPIHNSVSDFDSLRRLFADGPDFDMSRILADEDVVKEHGITNISGMFRKYDKLQDKGNARTDDETRLFQGLQTCLRRVIGEVTIVRDRPYIRENYPEAAIEGKEISFPDRNVRPPLGRENEDSATELMKELTRTMMGSSSEEITEVRDSGLALPTVQLQNFDSSDEVSAHVESYRVLQLLHLLRRVGSSVPAFLHSLDNLIEYESAVQTLARGSGTEQDLNDAAEVLKQKHDSKLGDTSVDDIHSAIDELSQSEREDLCAKTKDDLRQLKKLRNRAETYHEEIGDPKADQLQEVIETEPPEKYIVFSEHVPTVKYLFEHLTSESARTTNIATIPETDIRVGFVTGDTENPQDMAGRFAPVAQHQDVLPDSEIDVLIATEVMAEGHDLQDASAVVNYDLHWNPMRLEQRIGRIDRLDSKHSEIHVYNFEPLGGIEAYTKIFEKLEQKLKNIAELIGKSGTVLSPEETITRQVDLYDKVKQEDEEYVGDEDDGLLSVSASDFLMMAREFCRENDIGLDVLRELIETRDAEPTPVRFSVPKQSLNNEALLLDFDVHYSDGNTVPRCILLDSDSIVYDEALVGDGIEIHNFDRLADSPTEVFSRIQSNDDHAYVVDISDETWEFINGLMDPDHVAQQINTVDTDGVEDWIGHRCEAIKNIPNMDQTTIQKADEISDALAGNEGVLTDNSRTKLQGVYMETQRGSEDPREVIQKLHEYVVVDDNVEFTHAVQVCDVELKSAGSLVYSK